MKRRSLVSTVVVLPLLAAAPRLVAEDAARPSTARDATLTVAPRARLSLAATKPGAGVEAALGGGLVIPVTSALALPASGESVLVARTRSGDETTKTRWIGVSIGAAPVRGSAAEHVVRVTPRSVASIPELSILEWSADEGLFSPETVPADPALGYAGPVAGTIVLPIGEELHVIADVGPEERPLSGVVDRFPLGKSRALSVAFSDDKTHLLAVDVADVLGQKLRTVWTIVPPNRPPASPTPAPASAPATAPKAGS